MANEPMTQDKTVIERVEAVAEFLRANGETHRKWAEYFEAYPDLEEKYVATGEWDDAKEHRRLEAGYVEAIEMLAKISAPVEDEGVVELERQLRARSTWRDEFDPATRDLFEEAADKLAAMRSTPVGDGG